MTNKLFIPIAVLFLLGFMSVFTVHETEKAIKFQLGEILKDDYTPGFHWKVPFINNVKKFDARILTLDSTPERFLTSEKKNVIVDSFVKWRIHDVSRFYTTVAGDVLQANLRLEQIIKDAVRSEFSKRTIRDLVADQRGQIREFMVKNTVPAAKELGIQIVDIRIKRVDLPPDVSTSVYRRMESERARVAREFRSQGGEAAERIRADADKQSEIIVANAYRDAEIKKGEGDAASAEIYAKSFGQDTEFFTFYRSLNAYKQTFRGGGDMLVLEPDSEFFQYFKKQKK